MMLDNESERNVLPIRVLVANMSGVLLEIVISAIKQQPDMTVRHYGKGLDELGVADGGQTDVLIIGAPYVYPPPTICLDLWHSFPALKVLVLTPSGDAAVVYWLSIHRHRLKAISAEKLAGSIRHVHRLDITAE
jgi:hypothetical protein